MAEGTRGSRTRPGRTLGGSRQEGKSLSGVKPAVQPAAGCLSSSSSSSSSMLLFIYLFIYIRTKGRRGGRLHWPASTGRLNHRDFFTQKRHRKDSRDSRDRETERRDSEDDQDGDRGSRGQQKERSCWDMLALPEGGGRKKKQQPEIQPARDTARDTARGTDRRDS